MNKFFNRMPIPVLIGIMVVSLGLPSCEKTGDDSDNGTESYWDKRDAFRMQLQGKVHTMNDGVVASTFDESGRLINRLRTYENNTIVETFQYANGRLSSYQEKNTSNGQETTYTGNYTYGNHGKYIPQNMYYDLSENGLMKDLVKIETIITDQLLMC